MATGTGERAQRITTTRRADARVTPLELFFDLVFVLAITQCTALMYHHPTWEGLGQGLLVLALLWWSWGAYAWLTSVLDPEDDAVRIAMFAAMAGLLIASICIPEAFSDLAVEFVVAYGIVRAAHIALFILASRDDPGLRHSVGTLAVSTAIGVGLLLAGAIAGGSAQTLLWVIALVLDVGGPFFFGAAGWKLVPRHFAERHGLIHHRARRIDRRDWSRGTRARPWKSSGGGFGDHAGGGDVVAVFRRRRDRRRPPARRG